MFRIQFSSGSLELYAINVYVLNKALRTFLLKVQSLYILFTFLRNIL